MTFNFQNLVVDKYPFDNSPSSIPLNKLPYYKDLKHQIYTNNDAPINNNQPTFNTINILDYNIPSCLNVGLEGNMSAHEVYQAKPSSNNTYDTNSNTTLISLLILIFVILIVCIIVYVFYKYYLKNNKKNYTSII